MDDKTLVARLRGIAGMLRAVGGFDDMADHFEEAATRIEALEADNAWMKREYDELSKSAGNKVAAQQSRIEALKAALRECIDVMGPMAKHPNVNPWLIHAKQALESQP